jgi:hypothetical protein
MVLEQLEDRVTPSALNLYGDVSSPNKVAIDVTASGGIYANLNGVVTTADPGVYDGVNYFSGNVSDLVYIYNTNVPVFVESDATDLISIGNFDNGVQGIMAGVTVNDPSQTTLLSIDDSPDTVGRSVAISDISVTGIAPASISFNQVLNLAVIGGSGGNALTVTNTGHFHTYIQPGAGNDTVNVQATTGTLDIDNEGGSDTVTIGGLAPPPPNLVIGIPPTPSTAGGTMANINGAVDVYGSGSTALYLDDSGDTTGRTVSMNKGEIDGISPASIFWTPNSSISGGVAFLSALGGSGGNAFTVANTDDFHTYLRPGTANDIINVEATTGALDIDNEGGNDIVTIGELPPVFVIGHPPGKIMANINGSVDVYGSGSTALYLDDTGDFTARDVSMYDGQVSGISPAPIYWTPSPNPAGGVTSLHVFGGSASNVFTAFGTSNFYVGTYLVSGSGMGSLNQVDIHATSGPLYVDGSVTTQEVSIGSAAPFVNEGVGTLDNINGLIDVFNSSSSGSSSMGVDDSGNTSAKTATLLDGQIYGFAPAPIFWSPSASLTGGVNEIEIYGGGGGNTFNVLNTSNLYYLTFIFMGRGNDSVNVQATTGPLLIDGYRGTDTVTIGSLAPILGGTLANINGSIIVYTPHDSTSVIVDDSGDISDRTATLSNVPLSILGSVFSVSTLTGLSPAPIGLGFDFGPGTSTTYVTNLTILGGSGNNTNNIEGTAGISESLTIEAGGGHNAFNLGSGGSASTLNNITTSFVNLTATGSAALTLDEVTVYTRHDSTSLTVDDSGDTADRTATVSNMALTIPGGFSSIGSLTGLSPAPIGLGFSYGSPGARFQITDLTILGGSGNNTYNIEGTAGISSSITVEAGSGNDVVNVGSGGSTSTLDPVQAALTIDSQSSQTALNVNDQGSTTGQTYTLTSTTLSRSGAAPITYDPVTNLNINAGSGNDSIVVTGTAPGTLVTFNGDGGTNTLKGPDFTSRFNITSLNGGTIGNVTFSSVQNLVGGSAPDVFAFQTGGGLNGSINGGTGTNKLDYSAYRGNIAVDLPLSKATGVDGSILRIQNVIGSMGNDVIVGDANANLLQGGTGQNIIIGGAGPDRIVGGGGDNILIGGTTIWDTNTTALAAIFQEWNNTSLGFDQRVNALRQGIVVGGHTYALNSSTVFSDSSPDSLIGGPGRNWFFVDFDDVIDNGNGPGLSDRVTRVGPVVATTLLVSGFPAAVTPGTAHNFTVTALDSIGNVATGYRGTITFTSSDNQAVLPTNYHFTAADAGTHTFSATLNTLGTQLITATDTISGTITGKEGSISVVTAQPIASITGPAGGVPGQPQFYNFLASEVGLSSSTIYSFNVQWGDGSPAQNFTGLSGQLEEFHDFPAATSYTITVTATDPSGNSSLPFSYSVSLSAVLYDGNVLYIGGTTGSDNIALTPAVRLVDGVYGVNLSMNMVNYGSFFPSSHVEIFSQGGNDNISTAAQTINGVLTYVSLPVICLAGNGNYVLDFSGSNSNGQVGVAAPSNVLVGGGGADLLIGGQGQDILIGGAGQSTLRGGSGGDILIGGTTNFDNNVAALASILAEWSSGTYYNGRIGHLTGSMGGGFNGTIFLNSSTVHDNGKADSLYGGPGMDWFLAGAMDVIFNQTTGEVITQIS